MNDRFKFRVWNDMQKCYSQDDHYIDEDGQLNTNGKYIVEQCTGLKDKNGKLIYEGDIVKGKATIDEGGFEYLGCIKWDYQSELIGWYIEDKDGGAWELKQAHARISADNITGEVIGNIHENADLLENEMTWEELKEKAKELGAIINDRDRIIINLLHDPTIQDSLKFGEPGWIVASVSFGSRVISENRTYDQMYQIMLALR